MEAGPERLNALRGAGRQEDTVAKRANVKLTKRERVIYRTATGIVYAVMVFSIINFIFNDHFPFPNGPEGAFVHLGLAGWFKASSRSRRYWGCWRC